MENNKILVGKVWIRVISLVSIFFISMTCFNNVLASGDFANSAFGQGVKKLLQDLSSWILILAPIVTVLLVVYYFIRKAAAEEMDQRKWQSRIVTAIVCGILAVAASALINVFGAYFGSSGF